MCQMKVLLQRLQFDIFYKKIFEIVILFYTKMVISKVYFTEITYLTKIIICCYAHLVTSYKNFFRR